MAKANRPPVLLADGYVNAGASAPLRVFNVINGVSKVQVSSGVFVDGIEKAYDLAVVDDPNSTTGKSAVGQVPIAADIEPDRYDATVLFSEWGMKVENQSVYVDSTTAADPLYAELVPGTEHDGKRMYNLRVSPVSSNLAVAEAATDVPEQTLEQWFGLVGDKHSGILNQNIVTPLPIRPGAYTVRVRQRFYSDDEATYVVKDAQAVLKGDDNDTKPGATPFVVTRLLDPERMGEKPYIKHSVPFGDDHEQPNTRFGVATELVVTNPSGGEPDLPADVVAALAQLRPISVNRQNDRVILASGNPPLLRKNHNFKIKYVVTVTPLKEDETPAPSQEPDDVPAEGGAEGEV